jgi:hypothetical protein
MAEDGLIRENCDIRGRKGRTERTPDKDGKREIVGGRQLETRQYYT